MPQLDAIGNVIDTDVLIVGGGISGLWSAKRAREFAEHVLIVEKGPPMGFAGQGYFSGGGIEAAPPGADIADHVKDAVYLGDGLYEQDLVEKIFAQSWERIEELQRLGVEFITEKNGELWGIPQRGLNHLFCYLGKPFGRGGEDMMKALTQEALRCGVHHLQRVFISDLLINDGAVVGAVGFDTRSGEFIIIKAGATIIASGQCCMKGHYEGNSMSCGEGIEMAFRAGADLKNMEFNSIWVIPKWFRWEGISYLLPLGARFVDAKGEPFIEKYSPEMKSNIDYNYLVRFMAMEARKGNGPFYLDCSQMTPEDKKRMEPDGGWMALQYKKMLRDGLRPLENRQEWTAGIHWMSGGMHSDLDMATNVPGLYVAGKSRGTDPGIYFGGWSLCQCAATGTWAGENAARFSRENQNKKIDPHQVKTFKKNLYAPLLNGGHRPNDVLFEVQKTTFPYDVIILKNETSLKDAVSKIENIRNDLVPNMGARDARELMRLRETRCITQLVELFLRASIHRTETRGSHYREDYPERDDANWLKWIFVSNQEGKTVFSHEPVPVDKYKYKIDRFYMDNFRS